MSPIISGHIDVALIVFDAFVLFFIGLVVYLRREDRREGYPLEDELTGRLESAGGPLLLPTPKTFHLPFGRGDVSAPRHRAEPVDLAARKERYHGAPLYPSGNPMVDGIGPGAWAERARVPDLDHEGHPRIVPLSSTDSLWIERRDADPRGMRVLGADGQEAGTVTDIWVDRADRLIRYLSVDIGTRTVLAPMMMSTIDKRRRTVTIDAITAAQFADAPAIENTATITFYEEERVQAYFGSGYLYATKARQEPWM